MSSYLEPKYTLDLLKQIERVNRDGDRVIGYSDPTPFPVIGWYLANGVDTTPDGRVYNVDYEAVVYYPSSVSIDPHDRIIVPGVGICDIDGAVGNWDNSPFWSPGASRVNLRRSTRAD